MNPFHIARSVGVGTFIVIASFLVATFSAFQIDYLLCGEKNGSQAAGGGAALGMLVVFGIGAPTLVFSSVVEVSRAFLTITSRYRLACHATPTVIGSIYMLWISKLWC